MHVDKSVVFGTSQTMSLGLMILGMPLGLPTVHKTRYVAGMCLIVSSGSHVKYPIYKNVYFLLSREKKKILFCF